MRDHLRRVFIAKFSLWQLGKRAGLVLNYREQLILTATYLNLDNPDQAQDVKACSKIEIPSSNNPFDTGSSPAQGAIT